MGATVPLTIDVAILEWATDRQRIIAEAVNEHGSGRAAARVLGIHPAVVCRAVESMKRRAAAQGYSPEHGMTRAVPTPFVAKGHSTLDKIDVNTGERTQILQWTKTRLDDQAYLESIKSAISSFFEDQPPLVIPDAPLNVQSDIIPWIQIGDAHLGMLAHMAETGQNFDLKIGERELAVAIDMLIDELPFSERIVINDLGDFTHYENMKGETEASGHRLDFDGRFPKMITVYSRLMRRIVEKALTKARVVDVIINQGNHSRTNDIWMAELLRVAYGNDPRVNVLNNDCVFIGYRMGNTFVMIHHSDQCKAKDLIGVMITDFREDFGETEFHYIDNGHIHHSMAMKEHPSIVIEAWNNMAASDKWAFEKGYRSRQSITAVQRSMKYGEVQRRLLPIQQVRDRIEALNISSRKKAAPTLSRRKAFTVPTL